MHPNESLVRRLYDARARDDRPAIRACFATDVRWHDPYPEPHGGDLEGIDPVLAQIFDAAAAVTGDRGVFVLHDVLASDDHAVALVGWSASMPGKGRLDGREVAVFDVRDGVITQAWFYPEESMRYVDFFSS